MIAKPIAQNDMATSLEVSKRHFNGTWRLIEEFKLQRSAWTTVCSHPAKAWPPCVPSNSSTIMAMLRNNVCPVQDSHREARKRTSVRHVLAGQFRFGLQLSPLALSVIGCSRLLAPLLARHLAKASRFTKPSGTKNSQPTPVPTFQRRSVQRSLAALNEVAAERSLCVYSICAGCREAKFYGSFRTVPSHLQSHPLAVLVPVTGKALREARCKT
jgi:hypothetical protein